MKVNEADGAAAFHHSVRRHGRVDAAGKQARHAAGRTRRQPARAAFLPESLPHFVAAYERRTGRPAQLAAEAR